MVVSCRQGKVVAAVALSGRGVACRKQAGVTTAPGEVSQQQQLLLRDSTAQCCSLHSKCRAAICTPRLQPAVAELGYK